MATYKKFNLKVHYLCRVDFRLAFQPEGLPQKISYRQQVLLAGSCFAENIGNLLHHYRLNVLQNPNGILYNPVNIAQTLQRALEGKLYQAEELFYHNDLWASWQHHGRFSHPDKDTCIKGINEQQQAAQDFLKNGHWLVVTFGSAFAYRLKSSGQLVANCHKYPNKEFDKELLSTAEIIAEWGKLIELVQTVNPRLNILLTVSPVRYVRDGLVENNRSKARLIEAVHTLCENYGNVHYFPAYELVMDDLRDYRFFEADMVHPNAQAIEYVWDAFVKAAFDSEAQLIYPQVKQLLDDAAHRPFHTDTTQYQKFVAARQSKIQAFKQQYPFINLGMDGL